MEYDMNTTADVSSLQQAWQNREDSGCRNELVEAYLPLVQAAAQRMHCRLPGQVELDDLVSSGTLGLIDAVKGFDPGRGVKFEVYCSPRIRGAMIDELRSMDWVPRLTRSRQRTLTEAIQTFEAAKGRRPTEQELAVRLGVSAGQAFVMLRQASIVHQVSLEQPINVTLDRRCCLGDTLPSRREDDPTYRLVRQDLKEAILGGLSRAERMVLLLYYGEGMTMREIGQTLDVSESRVCQLHSKLLIRLRATLKDPRKAPPAAA